MCLLLNKNRVNNISLGSDVQQTSLHPSKGVVHIKLWVEQQLWHWPFRDRVEQTNHFFWRQVVTDLLLQSKAHKYATILVVIVWCLPVLVSHDHWHKCVHCSLIVCGGRDRRGIKLRHLSDKSLINVTLPNRQNVLRQYILGQCGGTVKNYEIIRMYANSWLGGNQCKLLWWCMCAGSVAVEWCGVVWIMLL